MVWSTRYTEKWQEVHCRKYIEHRKPNSEPMTPSAVPARPWQVLGTDLFSLNGRTYLSLGGGLLLALHRNINTAAVSEIK